ncbi:MAG TPA: type II toxin-antitoxin system VapC family toxin [Kofleriaceae bacterium]|nr:type II toxin-antitoxin system VapC family toxin [Kofleriaceae bacterium]
MALRYLLDTNVLSEPMRPAPDPEVMDHIATARDTVATASPVWHELEFGRLRLPAGKRRRAIETMIDALSTVLVILPYDARAATWHAKERARLSRLGKAPPFVDGQIAAIAAVNDLVLVTRNVRDFSSFAGLEVESWFRA